MDEETLRLSFQSRMTGLTAAAKAQTDEPVPMKATINAPRTRALEARKQFYRLNPTVPERTLLAGKYSRVVHGPHAIPGTITPA